MDTATYQEKMVALGIQRGALEGGFPLEDMTCIRATKQPAVFRRTIGERVSVAVVEDLTHLNPASSALIQRQVRERWAKLDKAEASARNRRNGGGGVATKAERHEG